MTRFMLAFGDVRLHHPNVAEAMDAYTRHVLMQDEDWPAEFRNWNLEGGDWGMVSSNDNSPLPPNLKSLLLRHGFVMGTTPWGYRFDLIAEFEIPHALKSTVISPGEMCVVCHEDFVAGSHATFLPCGHTFHEECILLWLRIRGTCPVCRKNPVDDIKKFKGLKSHGDAAARSKKFSVATTYYRQCLGTLEYLPESPAMKYALNSNLALMLLHEEEWHAAVTHAETALSTSPITEEQIAKARYRLGRAYMGLKEWVVAHAALEKAKIHAPEDALILKALDECTKYCRFLCT